MPGSLQQRIVKLSAQTTAQDEAYAREWWRKPGAVEEARRGVERKLAAFLLGLYAQEEPDYLAVCFAGYPGYPDAYSDDERTEIIIKELFHKNPDLKADMQRTLKEQMRAEGLTR